MSCLFVDQGQVFCLVYFSTKVLKLRNNISYVIIQYKNIISMLMVSSVVGIRPIIYFMLLQVESLLRDSRFNGGAEAR